MPEVDLTAGVVCLLPEPETLVRPEGLTVVLRPEVLIIVPEAGADLRLSIIVEDDDDLLADDLLTVPEPVPETEELRLPETVVPDERLRLELLRLP